MRIHVVRTQPHAIGSDPNPPTVLLSLHVIRNHPPRFSNIDLVRPVAVVGELVRSQAPLVHLISNPWRRARVVRQRPHQSLLITLMFSQNSVAFSVSGSWILVVQPKCIGTERAVVVRVCFPIGHHVGLHREPHVACFEVTKQQLVHGFVIAVRLGKRNAVGRHSRHAHAIAIGLHPMIASAVFARRCTVNTPNQPTALVTGNHVRIDVHLEQVLVRVLCLLNAVKRLVILTVALTADCEGHSRRVQQIALVRCVHKHLCVEHVPGLGANGRDATIDRRHSTFGSIKTFALEDLDAVFFHESFEDAFGDLRFERPHGIVLWSIAAVAILVHVHPRLRLVVVLLHSLIELTRDSADGVLVAAVRPAQATTGESPQVLTGFDNDRRLAHSLSLNCSDDSSRSATINNHVCRMLFRLRGEGGGKNQGSD